MHLIQCSEIVWAISHTVVLQPGRTFLISSPYSPLLQTGIRDAMRQLSHNTRLAGNNHILSSGWNAYDAFWIEFGRHNAIILLT